MRAVIYEGAGGPEVIAIGEVPKPEVGKDHIRVKVHAAGLNRADLIQRRGQYPAPHGWPANIPGLEYAGEVEAVRPGVTRWKVGDRVMGLVGGGAQAEYVVVHQDETLPIPADLSYAEAAAIPEAFLTEYDALVTRGRLQPGERVLIHAAGSGVGTAAAQIAKHLGATVLGTSRSGDKLARALVYGLDIGIDTSQTPFRDAVGEPVHVVLDVLGGPAFAVRSVALTLDRLMETEAQLDLWAGQRGSGADGQQEYTAAVSLSGADCPAALRPRCPAALQHAVDRIHARYGASAVRGGPLTAHRSPLTPHQITTIFPKVALPSRTRCASAS
jgi:D-arabinose 1-dehydrogenase-like Zn-dependent alcohol dehydrogenase